MKTIYDKMIGMALAIVLLRIAIIVILCIWIGLPDVVNVQACVDGDAMGFWYGLWHGWMAFPSFIVSLFDESVAIYAINNNGAWYNFGFILGCGSILDSLFRTKSEK